MTHWKRWVAVLAILVIVFGTVALTRPTPPGRVLYLRLQLAPYLGGAPLNIQYWIDASHGRLRYAEMLPQSGNVRVAINGVPVTPSPPVWYVVTLARRPGGGCRVVYTTLLDSSERGERFDCAALLALRDVAALRARALALWHKYRASAHVTDGIVRVAVPAGSEMVPLILENPRLTPDERMRPGVLTLDQHSGRPVSMSGYWRDGVAMTEKIVSAQTLPPGTLPDDFFDAPAFSWPDRLPALYQWLHQILPWH